MRLVNVWMPLMTPVQVDAHHPVPVDVGEPVDRLRHHNARVVAHQVHVLEALLGGIGGAGQRVPVGDIDLDTEKLRVARLELRPCASQCALFDVGDDDLHAGRRERTRHCKPDAAGAAGNECHLARYVSHPVPAL